MPPKLIVSAGFPRTGTTRCFNLIRGILELGDHAYDATFWDGRGLINLEATAGVHVLKCHLLANEVQAVHDLTEVDSVLVVSARRSRETVLSMVRAMGFSLTEAVASLESFVEHYERYVKYFGVILVLDNSADLSMGDAVGQFARNLDVQLSASDLAELADRFSIQAARSELSRLKQSHRWQGLFEEYDPTSQLHANHISEDPTYADLAIPRELVTRLEALDDRTREMLRYRSVNLATGAVLGAQVGSVSSLKEPRALVH